VLLRRPDHVDDAHLPRIDQHDLILRHRITSAMTMEFWPFML
jgi:hypothetical protein